MGNLGWYQFFTTVSKKVGGPLQLFVLVVAGSHVIFTGMDKCATTVGNKLRHMKDESDPPTGDDYKNRPREQI